MRFGVGEARGADRGRRVRDRAVKLAERVTDAAHDARWGFCLWGHEKSFQDRREKPAHSLIANFGPLRSTRKAP